MEIRRVLFNKKSIALFAVLFICNILFFNHGVLQYYDPVSDEETAMIDYAKTYENMEKNIEYYAHIPIFQNDDNIMEGEKTLNDYKKISNVQGTSYNSAISLWFNSSLQNYLAVFLCIFIIFISFDTENKGVFSVIHSTAEGRGRIAIRHLFSVFFASIISNTLFNISLLIAACIKTSDLEALYVPVQLSMGLENVILPVNGLQFFLIIVLALSVGLFVVAELCMLIMYLIHNRKIALTVCGIIMVSEYMLADWLPAQSKWSLLKYLNIATLLDLKSIFTKYELYVVTGKCFELKELMYIVLSIMVVVLSVLCVIIKSRKYPVYKKNLIELWTEKLCCYGRRLVCGLPGKTMEIYKMLITQKGAVVILLFIIILVKGIWQTVTPGEQLIFGSTEEYMSDYYEEWTGPLNEDVFEDIELRNQQVELLIEEDNPAVGYYANGLKIVKERVEYIKENDDKKLWLVNPGGYDYLIGDKGSVVSQTSFLIALAGLITIIASVFSYEKKSDMEKNINTTKNGRKGVKRRKYIMIYGLCTLMWLIICAMEMYTVLNIYPLDGLQAPIQSLAYMAAVPFNISIGGYLAIAYIYRLIAMFFVTTVFVIVSEKVKNQELCLLLCGLILLPAVLQIIGMDYLSILSVTHWIRLI